MVLNKTVVFADWEKDKFGDLRRAYFGGGTSAVYWIGASCKFLGSY
jgi:hypothetical protein